MDKGLIYNKRYCKNISKTQGSDGVGSIKCTLRKETKNDIAKFIDREFINEAIKEITIYIKTTNKVQIDDSNFNEKDSNSKVSLKDDGSFNVYDYTYVKDFIYELSWEGSYIHELKENEFTNEVEEVYKYLPREIVSVIYEKVANVMEERKEKLYKEFKKRYNEDFLFNSVRWYKRTRDGKVYYDMNLEELSSDKKVALEEKIKVEIGNGFKTRWGSPVTSKVAPLEDKLLLDIYDKGCELLGIENQYSTEVVKADNSYDEEKLTELMIENCKIAANLTKGINRLKVKVVNSIDKRLDDLINMNVYKTKEHMDLYLENARTMVFGYYKSINLPGFKRNLIGKEEKINKDDLYKMIIKYQSQNRTLQFDNIIIEEILSNYSPDEVSAKTLLWNLICTTSDYQEYAQCIYNIVKVLHDANITYDEFEYRQLQNKENIATEISFLYSIVTGELRNEIREFSLSNIGNLHDFIYFIKHNEIEKFPVERFEVLLEKDKNKLRDVTLFLLAEIRKDSRYKQLNGYIDELAKENNCLQFFLSPLDYPEPKEVNINWLLDFDEEIGAKLFKNNIYKEKLKCFIMEGHASQNYKKHLMKYL